MVYKAILFYFPSSYLWQAHVLLLKILFNSNVIPLQYNLGRGGELKNTFHITEKTSSMFYSLQHLGKKHNN